MSQQFSPDLEQFLQQEITTGLYPDRDAVLAEGLKLLRRERAEVLAELQAAMDDIQAGRVREASEVFADIEREAGLADA